MEGSIWGVVALFAAAAMTPAVLDVDVAAGSTGESILQLLSPFGTLIGLAAVVVAFGLLIALFTDSGGF